jgi:hypothetical protein
VWVTVELFFELQLRYTELKSDWSSESVRQTEGSSPSPPDKHANTLIAAQPWDQSNKVFSARVKSSGRAS